MDKVVTHSRYKPDLEQYINAVTTKVGSGDAVGSLETIRDCLCALNRQLSAISEVTNQHASVLEGHHTSLYNAQQGFRRQTDKGNQLGGEIDILKAAMATTEGMADTVNAHVKELDVNKLAHEEIEKEKERVTAPEGPRITAETERERREREIRELATVGERVDDIESKEGGKKAPKE